MKLLPHKYGFEDVSSGLIFGEREAEKNLHTLVINEAGATFEERYQRIPAQIGGLIPTHVHARYAQYSANGMSLNLEVERLEFIRKVNGGIRYRNKDVDKKNGTDYSSHTYFLFMDNGYVHPRTVIAVRHGGGISFLVLNHCHADETYKWLAAQLQDGEFFDVLDTVFKCYEHGLEHGIYQTTTKYNRAFVEGRLKKRRRKGKINVYIDTEMKPKVELEPSHI